jgi:hypothetical protein
MVSELWVDKIPWEVYSGPLVLGSPIFGSVLAKDILRFFDHRG